MGHARALGLIVVGLLAAGAAGCTRENPDYVDRADAEADPVHDAGAEVGLADGGVPGDDAGDPDVGDPVVDPDVGASDRGPDGALPEDGDGDGVPAGEDCDDGDRAVRPGAPERCNGVDDDCDDAVDEAFPTLGAPCAAGVGACAADGVRVCLDDGSVGCGAVPGAPRDEVCDEVDDDCDGAVDEQVAGCCAPGDERACGLDVGACRPGGQVCGADGVFGPCIGGVAPGPERCDGSDADCDGAVDEGFEVGAPCEEGVGACRASGVTVCVGGAVACDAASGDPADELCNGLDDDCDGAVDEPFPGVGGPCVAGQGACAREGRTVCAGDAVACDAEPGRPADEVCDGVDDDCDGAIDEAVGGGMPCVVGVGACRREGVMLCNAAGDPACDVAPGPRAAERCNGLDDDCDGAVDEPFPELGEDCVVQAGGCASPGAWVCADDGEGATCAAPPIEGADERCNGADDDCDGAVDEGFGVGEACVAGRGACGAQGRQVCADGGEAVECDAAPGAPADERCNGIDDDCDGTPDEGFGLGQPCRAGLGACAVDGVGICRDGEPACEGEPGPPGDEVCDAVDNDCDGAVDEGLDDACGGCGPPPPETCDGTDEDCDGQVDEGVGICAVLVGTLDAPADTAGFGAVLAAAGDLDGDGVGDALVGAPEGAAGAAALVSGADGGLIWSAPGEVTFGTAVAAGDTDGDGVRELFVGVPGVANGVVVQLDPAGDEVRRFEGGPGFRAGRALVAVDGAPWLAMGDRDARATAFGPAGALRFIVFGEGVIEEITLEGQAGEALGDRLFEAPNRGAVGVPDIVATAEDFLDRTVRVLVDPPGGGAGELLAAPFTNGSFGEGFAFGRLLAGEPVISAFGAPLAGNRQGGGVYLYDADGVGVGGLLSNGGRGDRLGHRLAALPRPDADRDALILTGEAMRELRIWELLRGADGRPVIATSTPVRADGARDGFGKGLALGDVGADGTRRLFVGEPGAMGGGRVYVFSVR